VDIPDRRGDAFGGGGDDLEEEEDFPRITQIL
jgi:hypothetical protein